jgi:hypothetical protein
MNLSNRLKSSLICKQKNQHPNKEHLRQIEFTCNTLLAYFHYSWSDRPVSGDSKGEPQSNVFMKFDVDDKTKNLVASLRGVIPEAGGYKSIDSNTGTH